MKVSFQDFKESSERRNYLYNAIDSKEYSEEDIRVQIETLKFMISQIKDDYNSNKSIEEAKSNVEEYIAKFLLNDISRPTFNDFYISRTVEYLYKNDDVLKKSIETFIKNHKDYKKVLKGAGSKVTENLNQNIEIVIASMIDSIRKIKYVKSEKFIELQEKIELGKLDLNDIDNLFFCVNKAMKESVDNCRDKCCKLIERNPEKAYKKLMNNFNNIFEVISISKKETKFNALLSSEYLIDSLKNMPQFVEETVKIKKILTNPFYGTSEDNDLLVFFSDIFSNADETSIRYVYDKLKESKQNPIVKEEMLQLLKENAISRKRGSLKSMLASRIYKLVQMQDRIGCIDQYNTKNNERLLNLRLDGLTIETEELKNILQNNIFSTEVGTALSAFYSNRTAKIVPAFLRSLFILDKNGVFEKIYKNPQIEFENLGLSSETIKINMAEYDGIKEVITKRCTKNKSSVNKDRNEISDIDLSEIEKYKDDYESKYHDFIKDVRNVLSTFNYKKFFYTLKNFSISSLIYTALTNSKNKIINWGYVIGDTNADKEKVLLGFDIDGLNMPLFLHMNIEDLQETINNITGQNIIPVYEGSKDWEVLHGKTRRMTTQVLYPITKKQRKFLLKSSETADSRNVIVNHIKWLQNPKLKPAYVNAPGSRVYDIEKRRVIKERSDFSDDSEDPNR